MSEGRTLRIASRGSRLALAQSEAVRDRLADEWPQHRFEITVLETRGDREIDRPLPEIGGKGLFTEALERALLDREVDLAVHSLKDLPTEMPDGLTLGAIAGRADPRDVWIARPDGPAGPDQAVRGARIGTSSERRRAQILAARPDVEVTSVRGNVETRIRKLDDGDYDALIMAAAGLIRLGLQARITAFLEPPGWLPAPGQGAIAVQSRADDAATAELLSRIDDASARRETQAERALLEALQGGCQVPVGARAHDHGDALTLYALVARPDGSEVVAVEGRGNPAEPVVLGRRLAGELLEGGAAAILAAFRGDSAVEPGR